jgi:hypothetical protein
MPAPNLPRVDLAGPTLVLHPEPGPLVQVVVVDLAGLEASRCGPRVRAAGADHTGPVGVEGADGEALREALAAGAGLVVLDLAVAAPETVDDAVGSGVVVVLHHTDPTEAVTVCDRLAASGIDTSRVGGEVGPDPDVVARATTLERAAFGFRVGACVGTESGRPLLHHHVPIAADPSAADPHAADPDGCAEAVARHAGWEVGVLTGLLGLPVATLRGVDPARVGRVRGVLHALDEAAAGKDDGP